MAAKTDWINHYLFQRSLLFITLLNKAQSYTINSRHQWGSFLPLRTFNLTPTKMPRHSQFYDTGFWGKPPNGLAFWRHIKQKGGIFLRPIERINLTPFISHSPEMGKWFVFVISSGDKIPLAFVFVNLKNHLRGTMKQDRRNNCLLMHCHKSITDVLETVKIAERFACANEKRKVHFEKFE